MLAPELQSFTIMRMNTRLVISPYKTYLPTLLPLIIVLPGLFFLSACEKNNNVFFKQGDIFPISALLKLTTGTPVNLNNKTLLINFWATWCAPCRSEMPELQQLSNSLDKDRFIVIGVSVDEDKNLMKEFLLQKNIKFTNVQDINQQLSQKLLSINSFPETFIISPQGIIIRRITGVRDWNSKSINLLLESIHHGEISAENNDITG